ncbi:MAG: secretin N-terminal domain-containing protein [Proteobacteria bacterium]|nr:secretin N-terminal domain-containing protein [Pseudomonadota bacterium]
MRMRFFYFAAFFLLFSSCSSVESVKEKPKIVQPVDIGSPVMPQMEKVKKIEIEGPKEVFSFSLREADIKDVLRAISKQTNYNVIIEPDVKGACTVDLKNVTLNKALEYILEPLNYSFKIEDKSVYVSKPKIETRIFTLNYITLNKTGIGIISGATSTGRNTAQTQTSSTVTGSTTGAVPGGTGATTATGGGQANIVVSTGTETDLWRDIENNIKTFLSPQGKFILNRQASVIMVMDYPKNLKHIALFLETVEGTVQRQVMIEAKIVEVLLTEESKEGINWSLIGAQWQGFALNIEQALVTTQTQYFNIPNLKTLPTAPEQYIRFGVGRGRFDSFIDLLRTQGKINIVSSPKISTLNNQRAVIKVATEDVFFETTTTVSSGNPPVTTSTPKYVTIGLVLDVVPQIDNIGNIVMNIHPMLTEKIRTAESTVGGTKVTAPVLSVREVDTLVKVREGESVIIGGLIKDFSTNDEQGIKGLMSIPGLGSFFKTKTDYSYRSELVIFLTPMIIYGKDSQ